MEEKDEEEKTAEELEAQMLRMMAEDGGPKGEETGAIAEDPLAADKQALAEREANLQNRDQRLAKAEEALRTAQSEFNDGKQTLLHEIEQERNTLTERFDGVLTALKEANEETVTTQVTRVIETFAAANTARDEAEKKRQESEDALATTRQENLNDHIRRTVRKYMIGGVFGIAIVIIIAAYMNIKQTARVAAELIGSDVTEVRKAMVAELQVEHDALISEIRNMRAGLAAEKSTWEKFKGAVGLAKSEQPQVPYSAPQQAATGQAPSQVAPSGQAPAQTITPGQPAGPAPIKKRF